jgi:hypothetical protein
MPGYGGAAQPSMGGALLRASGVVLFMAGLFIAAGVGIYLALDEISGDDSTPSAAGPSPTGDASPSGDATEGPTRAPGTVEEALQGTPFSFSSLQAAWEAKGITVTVGEISQAVTGFDYDAVDFTLSRGETTMEMSVILYGQDQIGADWNLGTPATPIDGTVPDGADVWYNQNAVVITRVQSEELRPDALDAFLEISA